MTRSFLANISWPVIGMVHLRPLPGTVGYGGSLDEVMERALADAGALVAGGIDAIMLENYGDVPFRRGAAEPHTIAAMAMIAAEVRRSLPSARAGLPLGINVLRNDPLAALGVAAACGAAMIRVNVHTGAMLTDQGVIEGNANATLEYRRKLGTRTMIAADVNVKHAAPIAPIPVEVAAADATERGLADALIVTGSRTGAACDIEELGRIRSAVSAPVLIGSGVTDDNAAQLAALSDGAIVGSWLKKGGHAHNPVDADRVLHLMERVNAMRGGSIV